MAKREAGRVKVQALERFWQSNKNFAMHMPIEPLVLDDRAYIPEWARQRLMECGFDCGWRAARRHAAKPKPKGGKRGKA